MEGGSSKPLYSCECEWVSAMRVVVGSLVVYPSRLCFLPDLLAWEEAVGREAKRWEEKRRGERPHAKPPHEKEWAVSGLLEAHRRRYLLRQSALELFFKDNPPVFLNLLTRSNRRKVLSKLGGLCPKLAKVSPSDPRWVTDLTTRWAQRQISNFEFLQARWLGESGEKGRLEGKERGGWVESIDGERRCGGRLGRGGWLGERRGGQGGEFSGEV